MDRDKLRELLIKVQAGEITPESALKKIAHLPFSDLNFAKLDFHRQLRQGIPEVIFGEGKELAELIQIVRKMRKEKTNILITRLSPEKARALKKKINAGSYNSRARTYKIISQRIELKGKGTILIISAGTSDLGVAEEARETAEFLGNKVECIYDAGVAGLHRLLSYQDRLAKARVTIVVAGMEGALPSVVAGLSDKPVIGVPTSIGYGASFKGLSALLGMLNTCANGLAVVNIDNGFGAACFASLINRL